MTQTISLRIRWGTSRARDTYGYTTCSLFADDHRVAACNGGGYDMSGTVLGDFIANKFANRLRLLDKPFYGLKFHDPNYDPGKAVGSDGRSVEEREKTGDSLGLERYQAFYSASSDIPTKTHIVPTIDGAYGFDSVRRIIDAIGLKLEWNYRNDVGAIRIEDNYVGVINQ